MELPNREWLIEAFDYDLWANKLWLAYLPRFHRQLSVQKAMDHILFAHRIWLSRCGVDVSLFGDKAAVSTLTSACEAWKELLSKVPLDRRIDFNTLAGQPFQQSFGHIAAHTINHGTYHRGHIRGLAEAEDLTDFPDTDLMYYLRERGG